MTAPMARLARYAISREIIIEGLAPGDAIDLALLPDLNGHQALNSAIIRWTGADAQASARDLFDLPKQCAVANSHRVAAKVDFEVKLTSGNALIAEQGLKAAFPFTYAQALRRELFAALRVPAAGKALRTWLIDLAAAQQIFGAEQGDEQDVDKAISFAQALKTICSAGARAVAAGTASEATAVRSLDDIFASAGSSDTTSELERLWFQACLLRYAGIATRLTSGIAFLADQPQNLIWLEVLTPTGDWVGIDPSTGTPMTLPHFLCKRAYSPEQLSLVTLANSSEEDPVVGTLSYRQTLSAKRLEGISAPTPPKPTESFWDGVTAAALQIDRAFELLDLTLHSATSARVNSADSERYVGASSWPQLAEALCASAPVMGAIGKEEIQSRPSLDRHIVSDARALDAQTDSARVMAITSQTQIDWTRRLGLSNLFGAAHRVQSIEGHAAASLSLPHGFERIDAQLLSLLLARAVILLNADGRATGRPNVAAPMPLAAGQNRDLSAASPNAVWQSLVQLTDDLNDHHIRWDARWMEVLFEQRFPMFDCLVWSQGEAQLRSFAGGHALEIALPLGDAPEAHRYGVTVNQKPIDLFDGAEIRWGIVALGERRDNTSVEITVVDRWLERPVAQATLSLNSGKLTGDTPDRRPRSLSDFPSTQPSPTI